MVKGGKCPKASNVATVSLALVKLLYFQFLRVNGMLFQWLLGFRKQICDTNIIALNYKTHYNVFHCCSAIHVLIVMLLAGLFCVFPNVVNDISETKDNFGM